MNQKNKKARFVTAFHHKIRYRTSVRLNGETEKRIASDGDFFTGVTKNVQPDIIYLEFIQNLQLRSGISTYREQSDVHVTFLRLFNTKHNLYHAISKLNVSKSSGSIVEFYNFWHSGISCMRWVSNREWN